MPSNLLPRNWYEKRTKQTRNQVGPSQPHQKTYVKEDEDFDEHQRSCDLDNDDDNISFSQGIRNAFVLNHFTPLRVPIKYLNSFITYMSLRRATPQ